MYQPITNFLTSLRRFARARTGNVAITFAIATIPIIGAMGAAIDYSRANSVKAAMQAALDSTALMLSRDAATLTNAQLQRKAKKYFKAIFKRPDAKSIVISASYSASGGSHVVVDGQVKVPTAIMSAVGYDFITVTGSSTSKWGSERLRVALVLDVTGSMASSGKMSAMKTATKNLITQLKGAASVNGDVYISIVPFNKDVNVGSGRYEADWIDWDDWEEENGDWRNTSSCSGRHSQRGRNRCSDNRTWEPDDHDEWNGCITDRDQDYDQKTTTPDPEDVDLPVGRASTLFPAEQFRDCPKAMIGLTYDWDALERLVDSLEPVGNTNQPIGLVWGWQSLVGGGPLTAPAKSSDYKYKDIIILLSDGMNTENRWSSRQSSIDDRMYKNGNRSGTCANAKADDITIYAIQVNTGRDPTSTVMQNCASTSDKFFVLTSAEQILATFEAIGTNLTKLRVAK